MAEQPNAAAGLVGRRRELDDTGAALRAALAGAGGLVLVTGEAGIGKTRFVEALVARTAARTLWGTCWDDPGTPAFWPWTTVLRDCAATVGPEPVEELAPLVGADPAGAGTSGPARQLRLRLFDAVASYLSAAARAEPLLIVIEDLHLADGASLDLVRFLAGVLRGRPVAILGTHRYPDLDPGAPLAGALADLGRVARTTALSGLDEAEVGELVRTTLGRTPDARLVARVRARTGGNPLFVTETAKLLAVTGGTDAAELPIPPSVQQVIARRLGYLGSEALEVLAQASVVGQVFAGTVLARVTGVPPGRLADLLDAAAGAGLVRPAGVTGPAGLGRYGFTHALVRDVLYAGIPAARRRARHREVAGAIEALHPHDLDEHLDELADHYVLALPDAGSAQALGYSRRAGERALRMLAYEQAVRHFARAVELAGATGAAGGAGEAGAARRVELLLALGDAQLRAGDWPAAARAYQEVAASARRRRRPDELARAALGFGAGSSGFEVRLFDQRQLELLREALDALADPGGLDPDRLAELRGWLLARLSVAESFQVADEVRVAHSAEALALARRAGDPKLLAYALSSYCDAIAGPENTGQRLVLADEMIRLGTAAGDAESELLGRRFRVVALLESGDITGVDAEVEAFASTADRLRWPLVEWYPLLWRGMRALIEGRLDDAVQFADRAEQVGRRGGSVNAELTAENLRVFVALERGRPDEAYRRYGRFLDDPEGGPDAETWLVVLLTRMGRCGPARALLDRLAGAGFPLVVDGSWLDIVAGLAEGCAQLRHADAARRLMPRVRPFADRFVTGGTGAGCSGSMGRFLGLLAQCLSEWDEADGYFRQALAANRRAGATLLIAHTLRQYAGMLRERDGPGDRERAGVMRAEADETYRQLGLDHWLAGTAAPAPVPPPRPNAFRREGETWLVRYDGRETRVRDVKGLSVLARLVAEPGREFPVVDLVTGGDREARAVAAGSDTGEVIDAQARRAYQRRLEELEAELDEAALTGDTARAERAQVERDALVDQLAAAYGLGGRPRRGNDPVERARSTVTKQIHGAIARIARQHPALARHLTNSVRTGRYCSYTPEQPTQWDR